MQTAQGRNTAQGLVAASLISVLSDGSLLHRFAAYCVIFGLWRLFLALLLWLSYCGYLGLLRLFGLLAGVVLWLFSPIAAAAAYGVIFGLIVAVVGLIAAVLLRHIWPYCGCIWSYCGCLIAAI